MATKLIMMRHGESMWNQKNLFTGWVDVPLSQKGVEEALVGGTKIKKIPIDLIFTSSLIRAQMTAMIAMTSHSSRKVPVIIHEEGKLNEWGTIHDQETSNEIIPVISAWELNERMYGKLQGLNKQQTVERFGKNQVQIWRRSFSISPPEGESLSLTSKRVIPYFKEKILPPLYTKNIFIAAHGNSLRALMMEIEHLTEEEVVHLEIPTGEPIIYSFENHSFQKEIPFD